MNVCQTKSLVSMYYSPVPDDHVDTTSLEIQKKEGFTTINFTDNFFESKNLGESLDRRTTCNYMRVRKLLGSLNQKIHNLYKPYQEFLPSSFVPPDCTTGGFVCSLNHQAVKT